MGKQALDRKLEAIESLRSDPQSATTLEQLRKALKDRNNYAVSKAAALAGDLQLEALIPDLTAAFERFLVDPVKSDPQCWAKNAIAKALKDLGHQEPEVFILGIQHFQPEPVWGGRADTATTLRATCAFGLTGTTLRDLEVLRHLGDLLADREKVVRIEAARAIAQLSCAEGILLLRLKALVGDGEAEVTGQYLAALVSLDPHEAVPFAARFLKSSEPELRMEAAAALAGARNPAAVQMLKQHWENEVDREVRQVIIRVLAGSPELEAAEFLLTVVAGGSTDFAVLAVQAVGESRFRSEFRERIMNIVADRVDPRLDDAFKRWFDGGTVPL